jgi:phage gp29-like protein
MTKTAPYKTSRAYASSLREAARLSWGGGAISAPDAARLSSLLEAFARGELGGAARLWDRIERRDDRVRTVAQKRKLRAAGLAWRIACDGSERGARHQCALEYLYDNLTASRADRRDMSGGVSAFAAAILNAIGHGYAVHELLWRPGRDARGEDALSVEALFCPLWYFVVREGRMLLLDSPAPGDTVTLSATASPLEPGGWLVSVSPDAPLHEATSLCHVIKRAALFDWARYVEKFGIPWVHGKTSASPDSKEWNDFADAVGAMNNECAIVTDIEGVVTVENVGVSGSAPQPELVDRMDRAIVSLWLGGDLATMSQGGGTGANPQSEDADALLTADARFLTEQCARLSAMCLGYLFGQGEKPAAWLEFALPRAASDSARLAVYQAAADRGVPVGVAAFREEFGLRAPDEGEPLLSAAPAPVSAANADDERRAAAIARMAVGSRRDFAPAAPFLDALDAAQSQEEYATALARFERALPSLTREILANNAGADALADAAETAAAKGAEEARGC